MFININRSLSRTCGGGGSGGKKKEEKEEEEEEEGEKKEEEEEEEEEEIHKLVYHLLESPSARVPHIPHFVWLQNDNDNIW